MFVRTDSILSRAKQHKLDRVRPPSPWGNDLVDEGVAVFFVQASSVDLTDEANIDLSYKKQLLQFIHQCQIEQRLPKRLTEKSLVYIQVTTKELQISNTNQITVLTIPSHHVITCYYAEFEGDHIVAMKYISEKQNHSATIELMIFLLNDRHDVDEFCSTMDCCFRTMYMQNERNSDLIGKLSLLTMTIAQNANLTDSFNSTTSSTPSPVRSLSMTSNSSSTLINQDYSTSKEDDQSSDSHEKHRRSRRSKQGRSPNRSSRKSIEKMIQNYLLKLEKELKTEELMSFCKLLTDWQSNTTDVKYFVKGTARLYGNTRIHLLDGLNNFLPAEEQNWFVDYLNNLKRASPSVFEDDQLWNEFHL